MGAQNENQNLQNILMESGQNQFKSHGMSTTGSLKNHNEDNTRRNKFSKVMGNLASHAIRTIRQSSKGPTKDVRNQHESAVAPNVPTANSNSRSYSVNRPFLKDITKRVLGHGSSVVLPSHDRGDTQKETAFHKILQQRRAESQHANKTNQRESYPEIDNKCNIRKPSPGANSNF